MSKSAKQVGAAYNSHHVTITYDRDAFDPVFLQEPGDFRGLGCLGYPHHRRGHDISSGQLSAAETCQKLRVEGLSFRQQGQPPVAPRLPIGLPAPEQVTLADHSNRHSVAVDNGNCTDPVLEQNARYLARRRLGGTLT